MVRSTHTTYSWEAVAVLLCAAIGCDNSPNKPDAADSQWTLVHEALPQALMSVWGSSASDVWAVGADVPDDTEGPLVLHWDGTAWSRLATGTTGDLWWVFGFAGGPVYLGGKSGQILRYENGAFTSLATPGTQTVYGIWGASPDELWAVGADEGGVSGGFAWRLEGDVWVAPAGFPATASSKAVWKVHGRAANDVFMVGTSGLALHWNGTAFEDTSLGSTSLFTVHCDGARCAAVGGFASGVIFEHEGGAWGEAITPTDPLVGVCVTGNTGYATGDFGAIYERGESGWTIGSGPTTNETLHSVWVDLDGGVWAVGGRVRVSPLRNGVLAYRGANAPNSSIH